MPNILTDQKRIWLFPFTAVTTGHGLIPAIGVVGATAGLVALDPVDTPYFRRTKFFHSFDHVFDNGNTELATILIPAAFYGVGFLRKDSYAQQTALLAGEAVADSEILNEAAKITSRRLRPNSIDPHGDFDDAWFKSGLGNSGFFSGHTVAAVAIATVFARRYGSHRWVPFVAYGLAGAIAISRITLSQHFPSDVFLGAALGYSISRFAVLRP